MVKQTWTSLLLAVAPQRYGRLLLLALACGLSSLAWSQNCGQRDTLIFLNNSSASIDLEISEYFNDDLSDPLQGLCGVEVGFVHQFVENLELSITSPAGQTVNLIGPNSDDEFDFTLGTQWNISFVPCLEMAQPDSAFATQWNNTQPENWLNFGNYTGAYYPFDGCLEDFDTGPVNGTWTFDINNNPSNNPGAITYLRLIFCDSRGVECCFTEAGLWQNEDILTCTGNDTLLLTPELVFPLGGADTLEYDYAFLIHQDGIYQRLDSVLDLRTALPGEYDICGFSYRRDQLDSLPLPDGLLTLDSIRSNLNSLEPWLCAELTTDCLQISIQAPPDTTRLNERICEGDSVLVGGMTFQDEGFYSLALNSAAGCDSIVTLDLFVQEVQVMFLTEIICPGDSFLVGDQAYFETGIYRDTLPTVELGCDSIVQLDLTMLSNLLTQLDSVVCQGENIQVGDSIFAASGTYQVLLESSLGCDSMVIVDLTVLNPQAQILGAVELNCATTSIDLSASPPQGLSAFSYRWLNPAEQVLGTLPELTVSTTGNYTLEISESLLGVSCTARDTVTISSNFATPVADAGPDTTLTCSNQQVLLSGPGTSVGAAFVYDWQTLNGSLTNPSNTINLLVDTPGDYRLIVRDTFSSCADTATVNVTDLRALPELLLEPGFELNCLRTSDTLDGRASLLTADLLANWTGPCVLEMPAPGQAVVDCPGWYYLEITNTATGCVAMDSVQVTENVLPALANIATPDVLSCALPSVELNAGASSPAAGLSYDWDGPQAPYPGTAAINVSEAGNYRLVVSRLDNFCRDTTFVLVTQDTIRPTADAGPDQALNCIVPDTLVGGDGSSVGMEFSYQWFSGNNPLAGQTSDTLRVTTAGTYVLEVTNASNGCSSSDTVMVTDDFQLPEVVQAGPSPELSCEEESVLLLPDSTGFSRPVSFSWDGPCFSTPTDTWSVGVNCPGLYTLTVTNIDNGCSGFDTVRVTIAPDFSDAVLVDAQVSLDCLTGSATLNTMGSVGSVFQWFRDEVAISLPNNNPVVDQTGMYTLVASGLNMVCTDTARTEVIIDCPIGARILEPDTINCRQPSVLLTALYDATAGEVTYQWTGPAADCFLGESQLDEVSVICPGSYQLIVEQTLFGLRDTAFVEVLIDTIAPEIEAGANLEITCATPSPTLTGTVEGNPDNYNFYWTNFSGSDTLSFAPELSTNQAGSYFLLVENRQNGCISRDIAQLTLNNASIEIAFGSSVFPCMMDTFRLESFVSPAADTYVYEWTGPGIQADADSSGVLIGSLGTYTLNVTNTDNGCTASSSVTVTEQTCVPCLTLPATDTLDCSADELLLMAEFCLPCDGCTLQWSDEDGPIADANELNLTIDTAGTYVLMATDLLGFSSSVSISIIEDLDAPVVILGPDLNLDCDSLTRLVYNTIEGEFPDFSYEWSLLDGTPLPEIGPALTVTEVGTYVLNLIDNTNECNSMDTIFIGLDTLPPVAEAGPDRLLTCEDNIVILDGSMSTLTGATYQWTGPGAGCLTGETLVNPIASCPGLYTLTVELASNGCTAQDTVRVTQNEDLPVLTPLPDTVLTCAQPSLELLGNIPPTGNYLISWCTLDEGGEPILSSCESFLNYAVDMPGDYQFTVVNELTLCENSFIVSVGIDTLPPTVDAGTTDTLRCGAATVNLNASLGGADNFIWSGPASATITPNNSLSPSVDAAGWYVLSATASNGCSATDSVQIVLDENLPQLAAGQDTVLNCFAPSIVLAAMGSTNSGSVEWQWTTSTGNLTDGTDGPNPSVDASGWYVVTLRDPINDCSISDSVFVGSNFLAPSALLAAFDTLTCAQDTIPLDGSPSLSNNNSTLSYRWEVITGSLFPELDAPQVQTDQAGDYRLVVQDDHNGCRDTLDFSVEADFVPPNLSLAVPDSITCSVDSVLLQALTPTSTDGFRLRWTDEGGQIIGEDLTAYASMAGWYYLEVTAEENGCSKLDSVQVFNAQDVPTVNIATPLTITCARPVVVLDGSLSSAGTALAYSWSSPNGGTLLGTANGPVDSTNQAGTYLLRITNTLTSCQSMDSVMVMESGSPIIGTEIVVTPPPCDMPDLPLGSISVDEVIGGTPPYDYRFHTGPWSPMSFVDGLLIGTYQVDIRDNEGCTWTESISVLPAVGIGLELGEDIYLSLGDSVQLDPQITRPEAVDSFRWESFGLFDHTATLTPFAKPLETQFILLTLQDENGCTAADTLRIFVTENIPAYIPNAFAPDGSGNNSRFTIFGGAEILEISNLRVFSRWGNMVFERQNFPVNDPSFGWDGTLNGTPLNAGVFVFEVEILLDGGKVEILVGEILLVR